MTTQPSRKLLISGLSENTSNESISGYLGGEQFGNPSVSVGRISTGEAIVEVTGLQNVEQLLSNIPGSFHGANIRLLPDEDEPHLQGQPVSPPSVSGYGPPTQYGGSVPQHLQHSSQMPPYNAHSRSLMHDQASPLQYPESSVQPTKLPQIQQVQGNQQSQIYDQSSRGYYGGQESQKYQTEYNLEHVNRGPGLSNPPLLQQRAQGQGVSYQGVSSSQSTPHGHPPLPRQLDFPSQWGQQKAPTQSGYQGNLPQAGYLVTPPQAGYHDTPPQSGYQGTPPQAGYHDAPLQSGYQKMPLSGLKEIPSMSGHAAPLQSGYQEISLSGHKEFLSMSGHGAQLQSGHQEAPPQSEHQEIQHQSRPQESPHLSGREDIPPNSGSHMLPSHFGSQNVPPSGPRKFPPHSGPQNIPPPPPCLGPQIENLPPRSGSHEFPPQSEGQELSSHSQHKRNPQEFPDQPETRNIPLLPQSQECPPYSEPQQIPPQSGLQQFPPQSGPVKFESQSFDNQAETSKGTLQSESPAFCLSSNSQIFSSESISQEFPLESEHQGNPMSARTLPQSAPLEPPPHMRPRVHNAPPQPGSQEHPSQSKPQEYSPKSQPQEYLPQSRPQEYPPQVGPQEYPLQSRPQGYLPQSRPQECPPQSRPQECPPQSRPQECPPQSPPQDYPPQSQPQKYPPQSRLQEYPPQSQPQEYPHQSRPQEYPPQSQPQEYPPQSQPQEYPPQSQPQEYPHQSRPQEYPPHSLSQGYLPQPGQQGYPTEPGKQIYPPHPRHEYQPQPRSQRHAPQPELQEYPPQPRPQKQPPQPQPQTHSPQTRIQVSPQSRPVVSTTWSGSQDIPSHSPINPAYSEKSQTFSHPPPWSQDTRFDLPSQMESFQGQHGWHGSTHSTEPQRSHSQHGVHPPSEMYGSSAPFTPQHSYPQLSLQGDFHQQSQPAQESFQTSCGDPKISKESMMSLTPSPYIVSPGHSPQCLRSEQGSMSHDTTGTGSDYLQKKLETCSVGIEHSPKHPAQVDTYHDRSHKETVKIDSQQVAHDVVESVDSTSQPTSLLDLQLLMEELSESFIVKVIDLEIDEIDEDVIDNLFSNEDEGGGDIEGIEIDPEKSIVYITFKDSAVAKRVSEIKQWSVMGQDASVSLHHKELSEIMKLFHLARRHPSHAIIIENVPKDTDSDRLVLRLEKVFRDKNYKLVLEGSDLNAILAHEGTKVLLILACGNDTVRQTYIDELNRSNISFKKDYPAIKAVCFPAILEVSVANIADDKCKEAQLRDYFANRKKSGGGPVEKVKIIGRGRAVIKFKGSASAESTMSALADHKKYLGEDVTINAHHPLFDEWLESSKSVTHTGKSVTKRNPFTYPIKSPMIWTYVQNRLEVLNTLKGRLKGICANAELDQKLQQLNIKPKPASEFIDNWTDVCTEALSENLSIYSEGKVEIPEGTSGPAYQLIFSLAKEHSSVDISQADEAVSIVGPTKEVGKIQELIQKVVTENMDCVKKETLPLTVLVYIQDCILKALQAKFKHVLMKVILEEDCLEVTGKASKCDEFLAEVRRVNPSFLKVPIPEDAVHLLARPIGKEYILSKMPKEFKMTYYFTTADGTIQGSGMASLNNLYLVADSDHMATVTQVAKEIATSLVSTDISVPSEFKIAERSRAWDDLKKNIELEYVALLVPDSASRVISVVSDKYQIDNLKEKISVFIGQECYVKETVTLEAGQWKFLQKCREWILLEKEVKDTTKHFDIPTGTDRGPTVVLEGETTPTKELARRIRALKSNICTGRREISKPGLVEHFYSEEGKRQLIAVGTLHDAVVEVSTAEDREYEEEKLAEEDAHPILLSGMVSEGAMVEIRKGDLTEFPVDVMVNAANEQLNHGGGIAGIISRKGGDIIQQESDQYVIRKGQVDIGKAVILKGTGNLPCKSIVHAVGPRWRGGKHHEHKLLTKAVYSSLQQAESKHFQSISFPAISSGIFGVPIDVCAKAMFDGITAFFEDSDHQMKVIIMLFEEKHVADFISVAKQTLQNPSQPVRRNKTELMSLRSKSEGVKVAQRRTSSSAASRNVSSAIDIRHGSLLDFPADVYVNTTASSLVLTNGAVSQMLLKAGGQELQNECNKYVQQNGNVKEWDFATTGPGKLKCKNVVHTVGSNYNGGSGRKDMEEMISNVMKECDRLKASSVAFPSIGTGALGFPPDVVAEIMVNVVSSHLSKNRKTTIKKILIVIYDDKVFQCFEAQCATQPSPVKSDPPHRQYRSPTNVLHSMPKSNIQLKRKRAMAATITEVRQGSLTSVDADVYVDTTAPNLNLSDRPVSKSLLQVAGQRLQDECTQYVQQHGNVPAWSFATTGPGNLNCKHVLHTVASDYDGPGGSAEKGLESMMVDVMQSCEKVQASSVAIPSIGAGNLKFPPDVVARIMFQTTTAYLEQNINTSLKKIILVIFDSTTYNAFQAAQPRFTSSSSITSIPTNVSHHAASGGRKVSSCIEVKQGSLTDFTVDVYINTTAPDLQLASRPVSKSLVQVAGQRLQDECTQYVQQHGNVPTWSFATTGPSNLNCKHVIHTVASDYDGSGGSAEKGMKQMIEKVMQECDRLKASSLAIPSIGAGNFHFPPQNLARIMIDTVSVYLHMNRNSSVKRVLFVIFDTNIFKVFQTAHSQPGGNYSFQGKGSGQATADGDSNGSVFQCNNIKIVLVQGDITKEAVDGIVNTASETLELNQFGVQGAILSKGGQELQTQCRDIYKREGTLKPNAVKVTGPGRRGGLKCQKILHVLAPEQAKKLKGTVKSVLKKADNLRLRSIALPAIGTGKHGFSPSKAAQYICEGIVAFSKHSNSTVTEVRIVVFDQQLFTEFGSHFQETGKQSGALKSLAGGFWSVMSYLGRKLGQGEESSESSDFESGYGDEDDAIESRGPIPSRSLQQYHETAYLVISVYADSKETVDNVITEIEVVIDKDFIRDEISDDMVGELSTDSVDELTELALTTHVELDVDHRMKRIVMKGEKSKVSDIKLRVKELFHDLAILRTEESCAMEQAETERRELEKRIELAAEAFHWQFENQAGVFEDFNPEISFIIEEAFVNKESSYKFDTADSTSLEIDFVQNVITDQSGNVSLIRRYDFKETSLQLEKQLAEGGNIVYPDHWAKMPMDGKGKELVWHPVTLSPTDQEYKDVLQEFEKTMTTQFHVPGKTMYPKLLAIKRIQNPTLYSIYIARKKIMDKANPKGHQNERRLFHGCAPDSVENINKTGFNRSFCGKNATAIGKGSYFATNASYSASQTYSPADTNGKRHIYLARVLTGEFTQGHSSMKDPPAKDNQSKYDSVVDNPANPSMYVVFYDTQAYPEHLIEFQ